MHDFQSLKLLDRFEKFFRNAGIDYKVMRKILQVKLTMDRRRIPTIFSQNAKKKDSDGKESNHYLKSLWIYVLFGLFMIPFIIMGENYLFQMSLVYGIFMFIVMTSMVADFSSVLLDIRDRNILFPKPVAQKTISAAKTIHVVIYLSFLTVAIVGIPLLVGLVRHGIIFFLVALLNIFLIDLLIVVLTSLLYMLILRFFDGEKLKDIINYVQISLSLAIMIGYQLLGRSFELIDFAFELQPVWWQVFIFPMWYGAILDLVMIGNFHFFYVLLACLGIVIPIISFLIYLRSVPTFEKNLQKLTYHGKVKVKKQNQIKNLLLNMLCRSNEERAFFRFASVMLKNERDFKLKVYPSLGFSFIIPLIFLFNFNQGSVLELATSKSYLTIYFSLIVIPTIMLMLKYSGKYKGAWIYKVSPIKQLKPLFSGTMKAFIANLFLPLYLLLCVVFIALFGIRIIPDLVIVFINACLYGVICFLILKKSIPFSESFDTYNQNSNAGIMFGLMLIVPVLAGLHFISLLIPFGLYIYLLIAIVGLTGVWKHAFHLTWADMN